MTTLEKSLDLTDMSPEEVLAMGKDFFLVGDRFGVNAVLAYTHVRANLPIQSTQPEWDALQADSFALVHNELAREL